MNETDREGKTKSTTRTKKGTRGEERGRESFLEKTPDLTVQEIGDCDVCRFCFASWQGVYAEGVTSQSPGSRRGEAVERTLGYVSHNTRIRRRRYTNDDNDNADTITRRHNDVPLV